MTGESLLFGAIFGGIGIALLVFGGMKLRTLRQLRENDPVPISDAPYTDNPVEIEGTVRTLDEDESLKSPIMNRDCVAYKYKIEQRRRSGGKNRSSSWRTIESGEDRQPFLVADESGTAYVIPDGASLSMSKERKRNSMLSGVLPGSTSVGAGGSIGGFSFGSGRKRYTEQRLDVGEECYIFGDVSQQTGGVDADVTFSLGDETPKYLISDTSAGRTQLRYLISGVGMAVVGLIFAAIGGALLFSVIG